MTLPRTFIELAGDFVRLQEYRIHLITGDIIVSAERIDVPSEQRLHNRFKKCGPEDVLTVGSEETKRAFIPVRNILYVSTGDLIRW